jgi:phage terminase large subunit-like protein
LGRRCYGGLDLASRLDTAAFALAFAPEAEGGKYSLLCWHWLPEDTARDRRDKVPYLVWREQGWMRLTEGNVCDYATIEKDVLALKKLYKIVEVGFDPWNAEGLTQQLERKGLKRHEISQTVAKLTYASKEFEKLIVSGGIEHDGNPVLDWQIGNVDVYTDSSGNIKPKRPEHGDFRTIDGVAAAIMALDRALRAPRASSYERRGVLTG